MFYLLLFVLLLLAELLYFRIADKFNIIDKPNQRSSHTRITLRGGGIVFYLGSVAYFISCGFPYGWFLLGLTLIAGISFADDIHSVPNRYRLLCQFSAMLLMFYQWGLLTAYPWWYILIAWIVCTDSSWNPNVNSAVSIVETCRYITQKATPACTGVASHTLIARKP